MELYFKTLGEGKPLLVLHGLFGSGDNWLSLAKQWAERYKVYLIDQRNHGHSPFADEMNYEVMSEDLYDLMASEGLRDVYLLGHSMGGKTALRFAQKYGFLLEKMVIADMGIKGYNPHHEEIFAALLKADVEHKSSRKEVEDVLTSYHLDEATKQFLLKNLYWKETGKQLSWRFNLEVLYTNRMEVIKAMSDDKIMTETLFLVGGASSYVPVSDFESIKELVPLAKFEVLEGAGHWLHAEQPKQFVEKVLNFLED
ncbi:MAG TPA: alpha/beta fold hydrolase [Flavobacteriales bacterium]